MERPSLLPHVDELVMEYLLFRGFTKMLQKLETSLLRLYVINAVKAGHRDKAFEFFEVQADKLNAFVAGDGKAETDSWTRWFILPYIEHPESDPFFQEFFSQSWLEAYVTSLRNFLSLVFRSLPLPKLLACQLATLEEPTIKLRLKLSQSEATRLRMYNSEATTKIKKLEEAGRQLHVILRTMVQHSLTEHFFSSNFVEAPSDRNKNRSRSRSHSAATASLGLSQKQMKDIGELFGICDDDSAHVESACVDPRDIPRIAEVYLPVDELDDDGPYGRNHEEKGEGDTLVPGNEASCYSTTPIFSPIATPSSALAQNHNKLPMWTNGQASLIREFNMLNDWRPTQSVMTVRSRFSSNGQYLAIAKLGNTHIDIWSADSVSLSALSTITLPARLTGLCWLSPTPDRQVRLKWVLLRSIIRGILFIYKLGSSSWCARW
uniref:ARMC9 CTLH-like domain-containing protein n=1 Tax=Hyaloperonospora arabidopsidis (strain Emoy2) TaxID=559515 RepID=M4BPG3_HYAAE